MTPKTLEGFELRKVKGRSDDRHSYAHRWAARCCNEEHISCSKSRSSELDILALGPKAPLYFLGAWLRAASRLDAEEHRGYKPDYAAMAAFRDSYVQT